MINARNATNDRYKLNCRQEQVIPECYPCGSITPCKCTGPTGYTGYNGETGYTGYTGYNGEIGDTGYTGYNGETGYTGYTGYNGETGYTGYTGDPGKSGEDGICLCECCGHDFTTIIYGYGETGLYLLQDNEEKNAVVLGTTSEIKDQFQNAIFLDNSPYDNLIYLSDKTEESYIPADKISGIYVQKESDFTQDIYDLELPSNASSCNEFVSDLVAYLQTQVAIVTSFPDKIDGTELDFVIEGKGFSSLNNCYVLEVGRSLVKIYDSKAIYILSLCNVIQVLPSTDKTIRKSFWQNIFGSK